jgi:WD40 repeat protein
LQGGERSPAWCSPDGRLAVTVTEGTALVRDTLTGQPVGSPLPLPRTEWLLHETQAAALLAAGPRGPLASLPPLYLRPDPPPDLLLAVFSSDNRRVLLVSERGHGARAWDVQTGKPVGPAFRIYGRFAVDVRTFNGAANDLYGEFSRDGRRVLLGDMGVAGTWDVTTGAEIACAPMLHLEITMMGHMLSTEVNRYLLLQNWYQAAMPAVQALWGLPKDRPLAKDRASAFQYCYNPSDNGRALTVAGRYGERTARVWDTARGEALSPEFPLNGEGRHQTGEEIQLAAFSPDGRRLVTATRQDVLLWDTATGRPVAPPRRPQGHVSRIDFSGDGQVLAVVSTDTLPGNVRLSNQGEVRVWDAATGRPLAPPLRHEHEVVATALSPDGRLLVTVTEEPVNDLVARLWETETGQPLAPPLSLGRMKTANPAVAADGRVVFAVKESWPARPHVLVWDPGAEDPAEALILLAETYSSRTVTEAGNVVPLEADEFRRTWEALRDKYPRLLDRGTFPARALK